MAGIDGKWNITVHTYMGDMGTVLEVKAEDGKLTGTATDSGNGSVAAIDNGVIDGDKFSYEVTIKTPVGKMTNSISGEVKGDTLEGTSKNPMGEFKLTAVRG